MEAGCDPARFWTITPVEAAREMRGKATIRRHEQQQLGWLAWHTEALARTKKMPRLEEMTGSANRANRQSTPEELEEKVKLLFGYPGEKSLE